MIRVGAVVLGLLLAVRLNAGSQTATQNLAKCLAESPVAESKRRNMQDYLIDSAPYIAKAGRSADDRELMLENGLIRRVWRLTPNGACVAFDNLMTGQAMLRSVRPEARLTIDGEKSDVGGLIAQPNHTARTVALQTSRQLNWSQSLP